MTKELIAEIRRRAELFVAEFDDVPASGLHTLKDVSQGAVLSHGF